MAAGVGGQGARPEWPARHTAHGIGQLAARPEHIVLSIASSPAGAPTPVQSAPTLAALLERARQCVGSLEVAGLVRLVHKDYGRHVAGVDGPGVMGEARMRHKLQADYGGDHSKLTALCRLRVRCTTLRTAAAVFYAVREVGPHFYSACAGQGALHARRPGVPRAHRGARRRRRRTAT